MLNIRRKASGRYVNLTVEEASFPKVEIQLDVGLDSYLTISEDEKVETHVTFSHRTGGIRDGTVVLHQARLIRRISGRS